MLILEVMILFFLLNIAIKIKLTEDYGKLGMYVKMRVSVMILLIRALNQHFLPVLVVMSWIHTLKNMKIFVWMEDSHSGIQVKIKPISDTLMYYLTTQNA